MGKQKSMGHFALETRYKTKFILPWLHNDKNEWDEIARKIIAEHERRKRKAKKAKVSK